MDLSMLTLSFTILMNILGCYAEDEKRILMSDPQYSHGIEATLQALTSRIDNLETQHQGDILRLKTQHQEDISRLETKHQGDISRLETKHQADISQLKGSLSQCQVNIFRLETKHQTDITQLKGSLSQCQTDNQELKVQLHGNVTKLEHLETQQKVDISRMDSLLLLSQTDNKVLKSELLKKGGLYVRWGRTTCPAMNGTEMVYTGYTGGSHSGQHGGAANHLCMPKDPEFLAHQLPSYTYAYVYGTEYNQNFTGNNFQNDAPCSVCKAQRTSILMLPGRQHCYSGWVMEYTGILVTGAYSQESATEYICLDSTPESLDHSAGDDDQNLLYFTSSRCGSLPCPPYQNYGVLSCVVCSK